MKLICAIAFWVGCSAAFTQGTFQNLDFEGATVVQIPGQPNVVTVANALRGWIVDYRNVQQSQIYYNSLSLGDAQATLNVAGYPGYPQFAGPILDGNFSIELQTGAFNGGGASVSISQTGLIPVGTQSLQLEAAWEAGFPSPEVSIGNDNLTLFPLGGDLFGANVSAWAGLTEQLKITAAGPPFYGAYVFDDISFSPNAITATPEPDALTLMGIGGLVFGIYRRVQSRRK